MVSHKSAGMTLMEHPTKWLSEIIGRVTGTRHMLWKTKVQKNGTKVFCCFGRGDSSEEFSLSRAGCGGRLRFRAIGNGSASKGEGISCSRASIPFVVGIGSVGDRSLGSHNLSGNLYGTPVVSIKHKLK
ncbi:hypothetical protein IV203_001632 [Nitzschia inconspicua]|uniref:Uncharacterized protein n=1 Tax=Nitzschia inconspicua TaxID=303405 RepID=A0A9K3L6Z8_9STRA|nr:hypothetical protein IV203_001632 [Nitzschia inconspicua]